MWPVREFRGIERVTPTYVRAAGRIWIRRADVGSTRSVWSRSNGNIIYRKHNIRRQPAAVNSPAGNGDDAGDRSRLRSRKLNHKLELRLGICCLSICTQREDKQE